MRLVTWNCERGPYRAKMDWLDTLCPDVAVVTECVPPDDDTIWRGKRDGQLGIATRVGDGIGVADLGAPEDAPSCAQPAYFSRNLRVDFLLGVWSQKEPTGLVSTMKVLDAYEHLLLDDGSTVVMGDLNSSPVFDNRTGHVKFCHLIDRMDKLNLVSAYHAFSGEAHGEETQPTLHYKRDPGRPFHLDYVFVPRTWTIKNVQVGGLPPGLSDHLPVVVDVEVR